MVNSTDIVVIMAFDGMRSTRANRTLLDWATDRRQVVDVEGSRARSVVICSDTIYLSPISPSTLKQRVMRLPSA